ncbi:hypothetical protein PUNSTDRAFT_31133, partial [Punctularia strigosozonata HHB-11173 SS5]|uniref:uncharacterized protein n=1 Tax=Punctularia strigosozonata (strain HHB-11173) TaxID=741275 RepID=UPI0004417BC8
MTNDGRTYSSLNETNYAEWCMFTEANLTRKGPWEYANGDEPIPIDSANSKAVHQTEGFASCLALRRHFWGMTKKPDQIIANWIADVRSIAFRLEEARANVDDEDIILVLTMGLPASYQSFICSLDATDASHLTLSYVIDHLLNEETRQT